ncbi:MAG: response regulator transcription factor [Salinisphaera sp.]|jgi:two-component system KDP operon response regulator KdpE|nr:response regulator transcription factor [Salinisphaera sp.]
MKALIVDDDAGIRRFLRIGLKTEGYEVFEAASGNEALRSVSARRPDVIVLDLGLPDADGQELVPAIRGISDAALIVLSVRDAQHEKIAALDAGADDYLTKPFDFAELAARLRASRRKVLNHPNPTVLTFGGLVLDDAAHRVTWEDRSVHLTPKEFDLLRELMRHPDKVVSHSHLLGKVWGAFHGDDTAYLRVYIQRLRRKFVEAGAEKSPIDSEPGVGYRLTMDTE